MNDNVLPFGNLTVDHGVELPDRPVPALAGRTSKYEGYKDALIALPIGDGFFLAGATLKDTNGLFNFAKTVDVQLARGVTENDTVYGVAGVRFQRITAAAAAARKRKPKDAPTSAQGDGQTQGAAQTEDDNEL